MNIHKPLFHIVILFLLNTVSLHANETPPQGFQWLKSGLGDSEFLKPKGWFVKADYQKGLYALFISKEEIINGQNFLTGFSLNFNSHISQKTGVIPSEYAARFITAITSKTNQEVVVNPWEFKNDVLEGFGVRVKDSDKVVHHMLISNDTTNSLFMMIFEAPLDDWEVAWEIGNILMNNLRLDAEI